MKAEWTNRGARVRMNSLSIETTGRNSKAILVIDMPETCLECRLTGMCATNAEKAIEIVRGGGTAKRMNYCPLRPLPETKDVGYPNDEYDVGFGDGWDACLKELVK